MSILSRKLPGSVKDLYHGPFYQKRQKVDLFAQHLANILTPNQIHEENQNKKQPKSEKNNWF